MRHVTSQEAAQETLQELLFLKGVTPGTKSKVREFFAKKVIRDATKSFHQDPVVIHIDSPINIVGCIYGDFYDLLVIFETYGYPPQKKYLFLGDVVGFGALNSETLLLLSCLKILYPTYLFVIRGQHECRSVNRNDDFAVECKRFGDDFYDVCNDLFDNLPLAALVSGLILCVSCSIPKDISYIDEFTMFQRPYTTEDSKSFREMMFSKPDNGLDEWDMSKKFDSENPTIKLDKIVDFLERNRMELLIRSSTLVPEGYEFTFNGDRRFLTISTKPSYIVRYDKPGSLVDTASKEKTGIILELESSLKTFFRVIRPLPYAYREYYMTNEEKAYLKSKEPVSLKKGTDNVIPSYITRKKKK